MENEIYIAITGAATGPLQARPRSAWEDLMAGRVEEALAAPSVLVDPETGLPLDADLATTPGTFTAVSNSKPSSVGDVARNFWARHAARRPTRRA